MTDYTDEILAVANTEDLHSPVSDTEEAIIVNVATRDFTLPKGFQPIIGVVGDKNSEVVSFKIDRYIDSHDISECAVHRVYWKNEEAGTKGHFDIEDIKLTETDENTVLLGWLIDDDVTASPGEISFSLRFEDYDEDGQCTYRWNTFYGGDLIILENDVDDEEEPTTIRKSYVALTDQTTGEKFKVYVSNGKLMMEEESEG